MDMMADSLRRDLPIESNKGWGSVEVGLNIIQVADSTVKVSLGIATLTIERKQRNPYSIQSSSSSKN